jgi:hypothetical protein
MAHDVFISHSAKDKVTGDAVCAMLESNGVRCWIAPRDVVPGMEWGECIIDAIEQSRIMVLVFSANANTSPQIRKEVERAVNHGVAILPLRIEDVLPARALEYFIGNVHWLDALTPPLEAHLKSLAGTIKMLLARMEPREAPPHPPEAVPLETAAPEPAVPQKAVPPSVPVQKGSPPGAVAAYSEPAAVVPISGPEDLPAIVAAPTHDVRLPEPHQGGATSVPSTERRPEEDSASSAASDDPGAELFARSFPGWQSSDRTAPSFRMVPAWAWGGALLLALLLIAVLAGVHHGTHPAPPATAAKASQPPMAAGSNESTAVPRGTPQPHLQNTEGPTSGEPTGLAAGGVWMDPVTRLMWTKKDSGRQLNWQQARAYCLDMRLAGYSNWRLPTIGELSGIAVVSASHHTKGDLQFAGTQEWSQSPGWAQGEALTFSFDYDTSGSSPTNNLYFENALCVRGSGN